VDDGDGDRTAPGRSAHSHTHVPPGAGTRELTAAFFLIGAFLVAEVVVALLTSSLALLADAGHMVVDDGALAIALVAARLAARPAHGRWTFGLHRAEILSAAVNGVTLLVISALVAFEAIRRLVTPNPVGGAGVVAVALAGIAVNVAAARILAGADRSRLNVRGAYRHVVTDLWGFVATALAGAVIMLTRFERADAIASLVVVGLMCAAAWSLLTEAGRVLLEAAPDDVDLESVRAHLLGAAHVRDVHDLHVWTVTSALPALSAHVVVDGDCFADGHAPQILDELQACVASHFDVEHSTFQLEPGGHAHHEFETHR